MKFKIIILLLIVSVGLSQKVDLNFSKGTDASVSYGFLSEKIAFSLFEYTVLYNLNMNLEAYTSFNWIIFGGSVGVGYKYYFNNKTQSSAFVSTCAHYSILGDGYEQMYGISVAPGYSIKLKNKRYLTKLTRNRVTRIEKEYKKSSMKVGLSLTYMGDHSYGVLPFISLENRF